MTDSLPWTERASPILTHSNCNADLPDGRHYSIVATVDRQTGKTFRAYVVWYYQEGVNEDLAMGIGESQTAEAAKEIAQRHAAAPASLRQLYDEEIENSYRATVH
jgi:hypothetical protein